MAIWIPRSASGFQKEATPFSGGGFLQTAALLGRRRLFCDQLRRGGRSQPLLVMQHAQRSECFLQLARLQKIVRVAGPAVEPLLLDGVSLVYQEASGFESGAKGREECPLQIEKHQDQIVLRLAQTASGIEIKQLRLDSSAQPVGSRRSGPSLENSRIFVRERDSGLRSVD